jgi:hypothetical protein
VVVCSERALPPLTRAGEGRWLPSACDGVLRRIPTAPQLSDGSGNPNLPAPEKLRNEAKKKLPFSLRLNPKLLVLHGDTAGEATATSDGSTLKIPSVTC